MDALKINRLHTFSGRKKQQCSDRTTGLLLSCLMLLALLSCTDKNRQHPEPVEQTWNFTQGQEGWSGDFAEYPLGEEALYELIIEHDSLPQPLDQNQGALKLSGNNVNSELFMFVKRKINGLDPGAVYYVTFNIEFASNMPGDSTTQDSPGTMVFLAAGAVTVEPVKVDGENNIFGMNIGKSNLNRNGEDMVVLGDFTNGKDQPVYALKNLENENPIRCLTNDKGELWLIIGIDSAYPASTTAYLNSVKVELF